MLKFDFSLKTRDGQKVDNIQIYGRDLPDAERKLRQMYQHCEITSCRTIDTIKTGGYTVDIEDLLSLIARQD